MLKADYFFVSAATTVACISTTTQHSAAALIDFEDGAGQDVVIPSDHYSGLTFNNAVWIGVGSSFHDGTFGLGVDAGVVGSNNWAFPGTTSPIVIEFAVPITTVSIDAFDVGDRGTRLEAFDSGGTSVDSDSFTSGGSQQLDVTLSVSGSEIAKIALTKLVNITTNGDGVGWDNLNYSIDTPGDLNGDGLVDAFDFLEWQRDPNICSLSEWQANYGVSDGADFDGDGFVTGLDFLIWQRNPSVGDFADWQAEYGLPLAATLSVIPEPSTSVPALTAALLATGTRRLLVSLRS